MDLSERFGGSFMRQLSLGNGIDTEAIAATYENGVPSVTIPIAERPKPRRIEVGRAGAQQAIDPQVVEADQAKS